jgi:hypothetical protein
MHNVTTIDDGRAYSRVIEFAIPVSMDNASVSAIVNDEQDRFKENQKFKVKLKDFIVNSSSVTTASNSFTLTYQTETPIKIFSSMEGLMDSDVEVLFMGDKADGYRIKGVPVIHSSYLTINNNTSNGNYSNEYHIQKLVK